MLGSHGERRLQEEYGSQDRATRFYNRQMHERLTKKMQSFIARQEMVFIATADARGNCDCSPRFGQPGFVIVLDEKAVAYPEFRGNGVLASLGNIKENPHIGLTFVDFFDTTVGLHVNGKAYIRETQDTRGTILDVTDSEKTKPWGTLVERWVIIEVEEAYIHCSKHVPRLQKAEKRIAWGTDDPKIKTDDFFCHMKESNQEASKALTGC